MSGKDCYRLRNNADGIGSVDLSGSFSRKNAAGSRGNSVTVFTNHFSMMRGCTRRSMEIGTYEYTGKRKIFVYYLLSFLISIYNRRKCLSNGRTRMTVIAS
jgi:hypothetical protein